MFETFFGLSQRPFAAAPLVDRYVPVAGMEHARRTVSRCIERAEGLALVIGPAGSGKTLLCHLLAEQFRQQFQSVLLLGGHLSTRRDLLQAILFELGLPYRGWEEGELRLALIDYLTRSPQCPHGALLIVDEAHTLSLKLLEELRTITNLVRGGQPCARLLLVGAPVLEERLASPKLESFSQRLTARCYLEALDRGETHDYVNAQILLAGGEPQLVVEQDALDAIYKASDGIPRLINQLCDHALVMGTQARQRPVDSLIVERAWADLQQLPTPWSETAADRPAGFEPTETIEFGGLEEEPLQPASPFEPATWSASADAPSPALRTPAEELPYSCFEPSLGADRLASANAHLDSMNEQLASLSEELDGWGAGSTEVELEFDEVAGDTSEQFDINLSLAALSAAPAAPQWDSTEFCQSQRETERAEFQPYPASQYEGEIVSEHEIIEEVVVDRYATLDALKRQGKLPRPRSAPAVVAGKHVCEAGNAEKSLTLAEALVQHATALEQAGWVGQGPAAALSSEVAHAGGQDRWTSIDSLPKAVENRPQADASRQPCVAVFQPAASANHSRSEEPELIIVEDDPQELHVQIPPQATAVKRQEYRQLFAKLRRS